MAKKDNTPKTPYKAFDGFLENFTNNMSYILQNNNNILWTEIGKTYNLFKSKSIDTDGKDKNFDEVIEELRKDKNVTQEKFDIINHAVWLWALPNNRKTNWVLLNEAGKKKRQTKGADSTTPEETIQEGKHRYKDELLSIEGVAGGGSGYVQYKTNGVRFVLFLFKEIKDIKETTEIKKKLVEICKESQAEKAKYDNQFDFPDGVKNLLLHLCKPNYYEPIAASADKVKIVKAFWDFVSFKQNDDTDKQNDDTDTKIVKIRNYLKEQGALPDGGSFYSNSLPLMWKGESSTDLSLLQKLEYKKAMILYGPPGTGKTYTAMELAKEMIVRHFMKKYKEAENEEAPNKCFYVLKNIEKEKNNYISYLQFHINYNYEDFIAGQVIKDGCVVTKKGFIFDVINKAERNPEIPYVVVLDEINRTDVSRVFGELFTAIEKRGEDVVLSLADPDYYKPFVLNVPNNIFFIGTMNEIDFSLERVDFALRRRFIWELHDYSEDTLEYIINYRLDNDNKNVNSEDLDSFCNACTNLNKKVEEAMGEAYHIGHAFFAEIANLYIELTNNGISKPWKKAKKILWEISIKPTLEAYCGSMDKSEKEKYLKANEGDFYKAFFKPEELKDE